MTQDKDKPNPQDQHRGVPITEDRQGKTPGYDEKNPTQYPNKTPPKGVK